MFFSSLPYCSGGIDRQLTADLKMLPVTHFRRIARRQSATVAAKCTPFQ
jgi:hypothetical protein